MISNVRKMILICEILLAVTTDDHGLKRGFFIEMDSACRNQQGRSNCDEVENKCPAIFVIF